MLPLAGLAVSIKDLFDVARLADHRRLGVAPRRAARRAPTRPPWPACAPPARVLVGHTNLTEFAFSGVGINPHHGTPANPATAALDAEPRIPGGSTSGGAVIGGQRRGLGRARLGHRRLDPHPGRAARPGRLQEHRSG